MENEKKKLHRRENGRRIPLESQVNASKCCDPTVSDRIAHDDSQSIVQYTIYNRKESGKDL